jgi:GNAT superfamily N-acetyltransferase
MSITIRPFQPQDQADVKALVLAGLAEHWGWLDTTLNPDLNDIAQTYAQAVFLTAWDGPRLVGCGALKPHGADGGEIVRMSVERSLRRSGIGRQILTALIAAARQRGCRRVILETTETWDEVVAFYLSFGFRITHHQDGDVYFCLELV